MESIREQARLAHDHQLAKINLKQSMSARMLLAYDGGLYECNGTLISLLQCYHDQDSIAILDSQDVPRKVDPKALLAAVKARHQEIMNAWVMSYSKLSRIRTAQDV